MTPMFPDAGNLDPGPCTPRDAQWCPVHGACSCPVLEHGDDPGCLLHGVDSRHAQLELPVA